MTKMAVYWLFMSTMEKYGQDEAEYNVRISALLWLGFQLPPLRD